MPTFNQLTVVGNLTRDPMLKHLPSQTAVVEGGIAMNRKYKTAGGEEREDVCFLDWACFGKAGEIINQYARKGMAILFTGRLKYDTWEDKEGGKRSKLSMIVEGFQFLGGNRDEQQESSPKAQSIAKELIAKARAKTPAGPAVEDEQVFKDDDIPF